MKFMKRAFALAISLIISLSLVACSGKGDFTDSPLDSAIQDAGKYLVSKIKTPDYGDEIAIISLVRSQYIDYWHNRAITYESSLNNVIRRNGYMVGTNGEGRSEDYPDVALAFTAIGKYADKTAAANFIAALSNDSFVLEGGYINKIKAYIAVESGDYQLSENGDLTDEDYKAFITGLQQEDGSFTYKGMDVTPIYSTANAVIALSMTDDDQCLQDAARGAEFIATHIREDDSIQDISYSIAALNSLGLSARDVDGNDLVDWILKLQRSDGSFTQDAEAKKGNISETAFALLGLASQRRFENGMTPFFDMTDILGGTHNKLSPLWTAYVGIIKYFGLFIIVFLIGLFIVSRVRIHKWRKAGIYNEEKGRRMDPEEVAHRDRALKARQRQQENSVTRDIISSDEQSSQETRETEEKGISQDDCADKISPEIEPEETENRKTTSVDTDHPDK